MSPKLVLLFSLVLLWSCSEQPSAVLTLDEAGEQFVKLSLELGEYDSAYVDSYIGPGAWAETARTNLRSKNELATTISEFLIDLQWITTAGSDDAMRLDALIARVRAMDARMRMVTGESFRFAEEAKLLFDVTVPDYDFSEFDRQLADISELLPGEGDLSKRVNAFMQSVMIPEDKFDTVFRRAVQECRDRTLRYISLPESERFKLEYVSGVSWGGYLEYLGDDESLMSINTDSLRTTNEVVGLACHEGYPGHHVYNLLVEQRYVKEKGWTEFLLAPLFAPAMLVHEGSAEFGVGLAFPEDESYEFQRDVLFPLAGLDPDKAKTLYQLSELKGGVEDKASAAIAELYVDGKLSRDEAIRQFQKYALYSPARAERKARFAEEYRSYLLNYSLSEEIVADYVEDQANGLVAQWQAFERLILELPSVAEMLAIPQNEKPTSVTEASNH